MSDLISRAEAKEALRERLKRIPTYAIWAMHTIDELPTHPTHSNTFGALDCVSRQAAIDEIDEWIKAFRENGHKESAADACLIRDGIIQLPSVQLERDIPVKPIETTDKAWGIPHKQAVCPKCDYYLSHISFLGDYKGKKITYCETCGQAIDWEGWDWDG